jgi:8-oxo-dGTP pyrophosphatase MutT (NUDIX family)
MVARGLKLRLLEQVGRAWAAMPAPFRYKVLHATQPRFLLGVVGLIKDDAGRVLLLEHRFRAPWRWGLPGGYLNHGERFEHALTRELREEAGITIEVDPEVLDLELRPEYANLTATLGARLRGPADFRLNDEILGARFVRPAEIPDGTYPYHADLVRRFGLS